MATPFLRLIDTENNVYNFPPSIWIYDISYSVTSKVVNTAFSPGGKNIADGFLQPRTVTLSGALRADTLQALDILERAFHKAILAGGQLYLSDDYVSKFFEVSSPDVKMQKTGGYRLEIPVAVSFIAEYPLWQSATLYESTDVLSSGDTLTIDNSASDIFSYPVITIEADQGADIPSVLLRNTGDGGMTFVYQDPNFKQGDSLVIDTRAGTVKRNGNSTIEYVTQARFLRLQNHDSNILYYEGADCTITVEYRGVFL